MTKKPSICLVTCYKDPGYIRVRSLEAGLLANGIDLLIVRNSRRGIIRYFEVILKLIITRFSTNPDVYFVTFRGYEILPFVILIGLGKKIVFDEFINLVEWIVYEHKKLKQGSFAEKLLMFVYGFLLKRTTLIITDTLSHAEYSSKLMNIPIEKYQYIPVGTDEKVFRDVKKTRKDDKFQVLYYGSMLPLHGIDFVIDAAVEMKRYGNIEFLLIGGNAGLQDSVSGAIKQGANIKYKKWVPFEQLPQIIADSDVCLGGPFGDTVQSQFVVTGKTIQFLRMGKPVIIGKNRESKAFINKINSLIVDQADEASLRDAIIWAYKNQGKLRKISKNGSGLYEKNFSSHVVADDISKLLNSI